MKELNPSPRVSLYPTKEKAIEKKMGRRKVVLEHISNDSSRASTFKKWQASIIKKAEELSKLCGIDVCVVVSAGPDDKAPVVWPPQEQAAQIIFRLESQQEAVRSRKRLDH